jgi:hypothetical protein
MRMTTQGKIGLLFSAIHLILFSWFLSHLSDLSGSDGQGSLLWVYWLVIDFPVSLLVVLSFAADVTSHYVMYFVHGILGTIWWFYVPTVLYKGFEKVSSLRRRR